LVLWVHKSKTWTPFFWYLCFKSLFFLSIALFIIIDKQCEIMKDNELFFFIFCSSESPYSLLYWIFFRVQGHELVDPSLLGLGVEVGLVPNIIKGVNIFTADVIKDFSYNNYDRIIQMLWTKGNKKKNLFVLKLFEMMPHGTLKFQIAFWAFKPTSTKRYCGSFK
jgi:hypothetical protein